jgi:hypothetical protein
MSLIWISEVLQEVMPVFIPNYNLSPQLLKLSRDSHSLKQIKTIGHWDDWLGNWTVWWSKRKSDGSSQAELPPSSGHIIEINLLATTIVFTFKLNQESYQTGKYFLICLQHVKIRAPFLSLSNGLL